MRSRSGRGIGNLGWVVFLGAALLSSEFVHAAEKDKKPVTKYWMSVATQNLGITGMPEGIAGIGSIFGKGGGPSRILNLQLNSPQTMPSDPVATHDIPPGQRMGDTLPLIVPPKAKREHIEEGKEEVPEPFEKPKARLRMYWGCGEKVRAGQPRVIDTEKMTPAQFGKALAGRSGSSQYPPAPRSGWVYSEWPNEKKRSDVPEDSSLKGEHYVHGNYMTDIRFSLNEQHDFMAPVEFSSVKGSRAESISFQWRAIPTAIGHFAMAMATDEKTGEMILWSSSEVPEPGYGLLDYLPESAVKQFIKEKVIMPPGATNCTVPKGIFKDTGGAMLQFIAYGDELDLVHPPKPKDPKKPWEPIWTVKVRLKSTGMLPLGETEVMEGIQDGEKHRDQEQDGSSRTSDNRRKESDNRVKPRDIIKGLFGF